MAATFRPRIWRRGRLAGEHAWARSRASCCCRGGASAAWAALRPGTTAREETTMAAVAVPVYPFPIGGGISRHYCSSSSSLPARTTRWPNSLVTLAIETSCDDTAVAVLEKEREDEGKGSQNNSTTPSPGQRRRRRPARARLLFEERITADNRAFGGIHPLTAAEAHMAAVAPLVQRALAALPEAAGTQQAEAAAAAAAPPPRPDFVAATRGPGMLSSLAAGLAMAKGLAVAWQVPLVGVHHMQAHALTPRLAHALAQAQPGPEPEPGPGPSPAFPYLAFLVSGGHTLLVHARSATDHRVRAAAANMAVGDLLDKCARAILPPGAIAAAEAAAGRSLPYGALLEQFANGDAAAATAATAPPFYDAYQYPATRRDEMAPFVHDGGGGGRRWQLEAPLSHSARRALRFDFSGLNGAVLKLVGGAETDAPWTVDERRVLARATMQLAFEHLASRLLMVLEDADVEDGPPTSVVVAGGVASNGFLRRVLRSALDVRGFGAVPLVAPPPRLCTDNAAMIAWAGMEMYEAGWQTDLGVLPVRRWSMDARAEDGGVLGPGSGYVRRW